MAPPDRTVVLVVGPGRSGTSTLAGALALSGYHVPDAIAGDESNPAGFHEPRWAVDFHTQELTRAGVRTLDTDPTALTRMDAVLQEDRVRRTLTAWLERRLEENPRLVIKDPRMVWFTQLWADVARDLGAEASSVVMLRHPSEVASSRTEFYNTATVTGVAGWLNVALVTEQVTSSLPRAFVHYPRLTADWRTELVRVRDELGLALDPAPEQRPHPVDDFIDPGLRRREPGWENVEVPDQLAGLADRTFDALVSLCRPEDRPDPSSILEGVRAEYARLHDDSLAIVSASLRRARDEGKRKAVRRARRKQRASLQIETTAGDGS